MFTPGGVISHCGDSQLSYLHETLSVPKLGTDFLGMLNQIMHLKHQEMDLTYNKENSKSISELVGCC